MLLSMQIPYEFAISKLAYKKIVVFKLQRSLLHELYISAFKIFYRAVSTQLNVVQKYYRL